MKETEAVVRTIGMIKWNSMAYGGSPLFIAALLTDRDIWWCGRELRSHQELHSAIVRVLQCEGASTQLQWRTERLSSLGEEDRKLDSTRKRFLFHNSIAKQAIRDDKRTSSTGIETRAKSTKTSNSGQTANSLTCTPNNRSADRLFKEPASCTVWEQRTVNGKLHNGLS